MSVTQASGERVHAHLTDGTTVCVRPARPDDQKAALRLYSEMSDASLRLRFFSVSRRSGEQAAARVAQPEDSGSRALVAERGGRIIGGRRPPHLPFRRLRAVARGADPARAPLLLAAQAVRNLAIMKEKVLVTYGSTNGSTAEIADYVGELLAEEGLAVDVRPAADVTDLASYGAVVLGGGLYGGRWHRDTRRFARRHRKTLAERAVWLFSSGPLDPSASERDLPPAPGVQRVMNRIGPRGHVTFGGRLEGDVKGRIARMIVNSGKGGDYRDFEQIGTWATMVARDLAVPEG